MRKSLILVMMMLTISYLISLSSHQSDVTLNIELNDELHATYYYDADHHDSAADKGILNEDRVLIGTLLLFTVIYSLQQSFVSRHYLHAVFYQSNYLITFVPLPQN
ncbi:hypothetical protein SAMN04487943_105256 [Gracilibacillus orientalis]|uniref:Uncharacterized protein n=1 Tax=Gracilibacillus orientalis TaxID=334253 RepID=A0A1I4LX70_9BACI|nr:hypothetical protein [Gracilibacillus orientalis]SFL95445.1 hypothetical protein SAMN04487943_105256 [Gracilibacillus orientalis]